MTKCQRCKGSGTLEAQLLNLGTRDHDWHIFGCDDCCGKGWRGDETGRVYSSCSTWDTSRNERPCGRELPQPIGTA